AGQTGQVYPAPHTPARRRRGTAAPSSPASRLLPTGVTGITCPLFGQRRPIFSRSGLLPNPPAFIILSGTATLPILPYSGGQTAGPRGPVGTLSAGEALSPAGRRGRTQDAVAGPITDGGACRVELMVPSRFWR